MRVHQIACLWVLAAGASALYLPSALHVQPAAGAATKAWNAAPVFVQQLLSMALGPFLEPPHDRPESAGFDLWLLHQSNVSFNNILQNIGGVSTVLDPNEVAVGVVVASPSRYYPDYFYQWTRDSALTIRSLVHWLYDNGFPADLRLPEIIEAYIEHNYHLQRLLNRSGHFSDPTKKSLGEPKFHPDGSAFDANWGRPQSDGPGLRLSTITNYLSLLGHFNKPISNTKLKSEKNIYFLLVKNDLIYIINNWAESSFDLWEEINSQHFFNSITQLKGLKDGLRLAEAYDKDAIFVDSVRNAFNNVKKFIESDSGYTKPAIPYIIETPSLFNQGKRSGLDAAILLGSLHSHNLEEYETDDSSDSLQVIPFDVNDSHIVNSIASMVADMKYRYPINHDRVKLRQDIGVGLGRYPEDIYDGYGTSEGNPWFISTASAAEVFYKGIYKLISQEQAVVINNNNKNFFKNFMDFEENESSTFQIVLPFDTPAYRNILRRLFTYSDSFLEVIRDHVDKNNGATLEQFNKYHGYMQGARDLTWSYSSFYNAVRWRFKSLKQLEKLI